MRTRLRSVYEQTLEANTIVR